MTEQPTTTAQQRLEDCLADLRALCGQLDQVAPDVRLDACSAPTGPRRELAQEAEANLGIVRQQLREAALRLEVALTLHRSAVSPWITDGAGEQRGGVPSPPEG